MTNPTLNGSPTRRSPFSRASPSPSSSPSLAPIRPSQYPPGGRPKSMIVNSPSDQNVCHSRNHSFSQLASSPSLPSRMRAQSTVNRNSSSSTFAPQFIKSEAMRQGSGKINGIEGENDFSGKRYVWLGDVENAFVRGWVAEDLENGHILVQCDDGSQREASPDAVDKVNPAKFDKADDMAELTHLNEASVVHNLHMRYQSDLIYTYSGLFLVTVNPYCPLPIYSNEYIKMYKGQSREDTRPHIFAMADQAFRNLVEEGVNQSILVTGESGAGKTENTKKVIQYLTAVATTDTPRAGRSPTKQFSNLSQQILRANPILEAFGNAQTVRNNNSSRFGKFIRIEFSRSGQVSRAFIDWYLLEKSRVVKLNSQERTYHVFYQLLQGADERLRDQFLLADMDVEDFAYTRAGNDTISGVSDKDEWKSLIEAFHVMNFAEQDQTAILKTIAAVLYLGNITVMKESTRADQACLTAEAYEAVDKACQLLGVQPEPFIQGLLHPKVKAGREWVEKVQTPEQVRLAVDALSKGIYERGFGDLVTRINQQLDRSGMSGEDTKFIGVLDIAGFEIFEENSFEQLCINYTNEKLQQFFNHHMFVLEQEEYAREQIEWQFIDFGKDLQPTIDLIEVSNPIGIFSCLDEDSVMPRATDSSFTEKLHLLWGKKTPKYKPSRLRQGFMLTHYAAEVEYSTDGWLDKNKDPLNDNLTRLLAASTNKHVANLFSDCGDSIEEVSSPRSRVKKGLFRTVAQRHKEQLSSLMAQLHQTHPHFVRCILPNHKKKSKQFNAPLVLDQLRCNGVLEGIRIARTGFPNRLPFAEFRSRYEVLCRNMPRGYLAGQEATSIMLERLNLDKALYRVGLTKVFFRAGVLAELEEQRDTLIRDIMSRFQSVARGFMQRRIANKRLYRAEAARIIQRNLNIYLDLQANPWWRLFMKMKPLLGATRTAGEVKKRDKMIQQLEAKMQQSLEDKQRLEDDRRRADIEVQRTQQTLESERALALDKEEIFKRLQNREIELSEKLADAIADQETLEDQLDDLLAAKKKAEEELELRRTQLQQAGLIVSRLENDKKDLQHEIDDLDSHLDEVEKTHSDKDGRVEALDKEIRVLNSQLSIRDRKLQDLEAQLEQSRLAMTRLENEKKDLQQEIKDLDSQLDEVEKTQSTKNGRVEALDQEIRMLSSQLSLKDRKLQELEARLLKTDQDLDVKLANTSKELTVSKKQVKDLLEENRSVRQQLAQVSSTSADYEDLVRRKESELAVLRGDLKRHDSEKRSINSERKSLMSRHDSMQSRLREVQAEMEALKSHKANLERDVQAKTEAIKSHKATLEREVRAGREAMYQKAHLEREALDAKALLEARISQDAQSGESRKMLDKQLADLKRQLTDVRTELSRERQSRDDVQMLSDHQLTELKEKYEHQVRELQDSNHLLADDLTHQRQCLTDHQAVSDRKLSDLQEKYDQLNDSKIIIEKELYVQQDTLRRAISNLLATIDELQSSDAQSRIAAKRAESQLREERDKAIRLERELEEWRGSRGERERERAGGLGYRNGPMAPVGELAEGKVEGGSRRPSGVSGSGSGSVASECGSGSGSGESAVGGGGGGGGGGGVYRKPSNTKGFL